MAARRDDFLVGLTVLAVVALVVAASLWVGESDRGRRRASVEARFRDVGNTQPGDALVIRGVRAGQVEALELTEGGWVLVRFAVDPQVPLPPDPVVLLGSASLFGDWQATMLDRATLPDNPDVRAAIAEATAAGDGVMPGAVLPDLEQLTTTAGRIAGDVATLADRARLAFDDSAARELRDGFRHFGRMSRDLERTVAVQSRNLDTLAAGLQVGVQRVNAATAALQRTLERADSATAAGALAATVDDTRAAAAQLRAATAELQALVARLGQSEARLGQAVARADSVAAKVNGHDGTLGRLVNDPALYANSDSLLVELRALVADIRANPRRYVSVKLF